MKKFLLTLILIVVNTVFLTNCKKADPVPDCEVNHYGHVTVINDTVLPLWVDVTWTGVGENYEKKLYPGESYPYDRIPAGTIKLWHRYDGYLWEYVSDYLYDCDDMECRWVYDTDKSTNSTPMLEIFRNGELVETITEFIKIEK